MKEIICFDLDNTLIYSDDAQVEAYNKAFLRSGLKVVEERRLKGLLNGALGERIIKSLFPFLNKEQVREVEIQHRMAIINECSGKARMLTKNTIETLKKLKRQYVLVLVSNNTTEGIYALMRGAKLPPELFERIIGKDKVKKGKPAPDEIFKAEKLLHHKVALMIGDSIFDVRAGKRAKVKTIAVLTGNCSRKELEKEKPDFIVSNIDIVPVILEKNKIFKERDR